jgi:hypothetical protein
MVQFRKSLDRASRIAVVARIFAIRGKRDRGKKAD